MQSDFLDETDLVDAARTIESRYEHEDLYSKEPIKSTGVAYSGRKSITYVLFE